MRYLNFFDGMVFYITMMSIFKKIYQWWQQCFNLATTLRFKQSNDIGKHGLIRQSSFTCLVKLNWLFLVSPVLKRLWFPHRAVAAGEAQLTTFKNSI